MYKYRIVHTSTGWIVYQSKVWQEKEDAVKIAQRLVNDQDRPNDYKFQLRSENEDYFHDYNSLMDTLDKTKT